jgi:hypothetical protein
MVLKCSILFLIQTIFSNIVNIDLKNHKNEQYYGAITINDVTITVVYDTGSNIIWIRDNKTQIYDCKDIQDCKNKYSSNEQSDSLYFIKYGTGMVAIKNSIGDIKLASDTKLTFNLNRVKYGISVFEEKKVFSEVIIYY